MYIQKASQFVMIQGITHASIKSVKDVCGHTIDARKIVIDKCEICPLGKHTSLPFANSDTRSDRAFALLNFAIYGPYNTQTFETSLLLPLWMTSQELLGFLC